MKVVDAIGPVVFKDREARRLKEFGVAVLPRPVVSTWTGERIPRSAPLARLEFLEYGVVARFATERGRARNSFEPAVCPVGRLGERRWVKEGWQPSGFDDLWWYRADARTGMTFRGELYKPASSMPRKASRFEVVFDDVTMRSTRTIPGVEVVCAGFDAPECARIFEKASRGVRWEFQRWLCYPDDGLTLGVAYCPDCARRKADEEGLEVDGWDEHHEEDSPRWCDSCDVLLRHSLTAYGVDEELGNMDVGPVDRDDAAILANLAGGIGDLRARHHGALARLAYATHAASGKRDSWASDDWTWILYARKA